MPGPRPTSVRLAPWALLALFVGRAAGIASLSARGPKICTHLKGLNAGAQRTHSDFDCGAFALLQDGHNGKTTRLDYLVQLKASLRKEHTLSLTAVRLLRSRHGWTKDGKTTRLDDLVQLKTSVRKEHTLTLTAVPLLCSGHGRTNDGHNGKTTRLDYLPN